MPAESDRFGLRTEGISLRLDLVSTCVLELTTESVSYIIYLPCLIAPCFAAHDGNVHGISARVVFRLVQSYF